MLRRFDFVPAVDEQITQRVAHQFMAEVDAIALAAKGMTVVSVLREQAARAVGWHIGERQAQPGCE